MYSEKQKPPRQALGFTIHSSFCHGDGSRQETGPERGRRGKRVCRGVGREGELACQGLTMNRLCQENGRTGRAIFRGSDLPLPGSSNPSHHPPPPCSFVLSGAWQIGGDFKATDRKELKHNEGNAAGRGEMGAQK